MFKLGDHAYEVEWADTPPPVDECGDWILELVDYHTKVVSTEEEAWRLAKNVYPSDIFGSVRVSHVVLEDPYGDRLPSTYIWEPLGDPEHYEGEE